MRILFLTQVLPFPLDAGPKVRAHHVIQYLAAAGHEVHLLSYVRAGDTEAHVAALRRLCASVETVPMARSSLRDLRDGIHSLVRDAPFLILRDDTDGMRSALERIATRMSFDALHADQLWMATYGMSARRFAPLTVLDQHNAVFQVPSRLAEHQRNPAIRRLLRHEAGKLQRFEQQACRQFDRVVWVTEDDRNAVLPSPSDRRNCDVVIPIAADPAAQPKLRRSRPFRVTFLGGLHWPPNRDGVSWFLENVWPRVAAAAPSALLTIIGKHGRSPLPASDLPRVEITGYVHDPRPYLSETAVFVVPLLSGAGMRVKILDAWCWGLPMVSTRIGAEGLRAVHDENLLLADDADAFARSVIRLIQEPRTAERLASDGRATVERHYDWRTTYTAWDKIYRAPDVQYHGTRPMSAAAS